MIIWMLLVSLFCKSTQDGNGKENGFLHCEPQNMNLTTPEQKIKLTWEDDPACTLAVHDVLMYEVLVLIEDKQVHHDTVAVTPDQRGSTHSWNWIPHLALECASHSVRLSSRYKNQTSPWKQEQTHPGIGNSETPEVFPRDNLFKVGSRVTFCCVLPAGDIFDRMYLNPHSAGINMNTTKISNQMYALTVDLNQATNTSCTDVMCETHTKDPEQTKRNGACAYIGYPPNDSDLHCETRDLKSVACRWTVGNTHVGIKSPTKYKLHGRPCPDKSNGECSQEAQVNVGEQNWTLTAENELGTLEVIDRADLTKRVHMFAPEVTASDVKARSARMMLRWMHHYNNLSITCQTNVNGEINTTSENFNGLNSIILDDLIPYWPYTVMVRCGTTQHFWKWSEWSSSIKFRTNGDVPDALDVWMQMKENQITIIWKMLQAKQSHGDIRDYEVTWAYKNNTERKNRTTVANFNSLALSLDTTKEYIIGVTARNDNGSSSPSTITIPSFNSANGVNTSRMEGSKEGSNGGFNLSWPASPTASCGYIVDWCCAVKESRVEWLKVPQHETNASIFSKNFKDGVRYLLSIYACTQGAPVLLERREGYVKETKLQDDLFRSLKVKQLDSYVEVSWDPIPLKEQTAFINGYTLDCLDYNNNVVINVSKDDPEATSLTVRNLQSGTYTFTVKAQTAVGKCGTSSISATLNSPDNLIKVVFISLVVVSAYLALITILCYRHWTCIKQKVYPPIPKPVLRDKWLKSPSEHSCPFHVNLYQHSEAHIMDVPELHRKLDAPVNDYIIQDKTPCVFTQTSKGYYNQPLKKNIPPPLILPTTIPSGLPSSPFKSVFPNPSYKLIMQNGDQETNSEPDFHERRPLERCSSGYQPQSLVNQQEEGPDSPLSCISTYILLPK